MKGWSFPHYLLGALPSVLQGYLGFHGGTGQLVQFMSMLSGEKPVLDDWIPCERLDALQEFARATGLFVEVDSLFEFVDVSSIGAEVVGGGQLNTTRAIGWPVDAGAPGRRAHVFLSRDAAMARRARDCGWYALVIDGRVVEKPWIEHDRFGGLLGYPPCCRRFFAAHNDWNTENTLYQAAIRTSRPQFLCNSLMKHAGIAYSVHLPCSFDCDASRRLAERVASMVRTTSDALADHVDDVLSRPYLVLSEWEAYGFRGRIDERGGLSYDEVFAVPSNRPDEELLGLLERGDTLLLEGPLCKVWRQGTLLGIHESRCDRFGPQAPHLIDFTPRA